MTAISDSLSIYTLDAVKQICLSNNCIIIRSRVSMRLVAAESVNLAAEDTTAMTFSIHI